MRTLLGLLAVLLTATSAAAQTGGCPTCWRSQLYPPDWQPGDSDGAGRALPDFSYAGYRQGEVELPDSAGLTVFDAVADFDADATGASDATAAIQAALDAAATHGGGLVLLPAGDYRCDGTLRLDGDGVVLRGAGPSQTRLRFTAHAGMSYAAHLKVGGALTQGAEAALAQDGAPGSVQVALNDASAFAVGDDVAVGWVITAAFIAEHGMTGTWVSFTDQWKPVFRRRVVAIDTSSTPHRLTLDVPLRYPAKTRDQASVRRETGYVREVGVELLSISNAAPWADAWAENQVDALRLEGVADGWVRHVRSYDPPQVSGTYHLQSGGIAVAASKRVTIRDCRLEKPANRGSGGNGYLFQVTRSNEILFRDCTAVDGRHNFIQNWDFGTSGCVFTGLDSAGSATVTTDPILIALPAYCEYHHSLATANLVEDSRIADGWYGGNRGSESSGAGHTATDVVYWNLRGGGTITSMAYGWGYVIAPNDMILSVNLLDPRAAGTAPEDFVETRAGQIQPLSLYDDQLRRRLGRGHCGDDQCGGGESCQSCPADCLPCSADGALASDGGDPSPGDGAGPADGAPPATGDDDEPPTTPHKPGACGCTGAGELAPLLLPLLLGLSGRARRRRTA